MSRLDTADVVLVNMPFGSIHCPSIGLSLLAEGLRADDVSAKVLYPNLQFANAIGRESYSVFAEPSELTCYHAAGEWIFSGAVFEQTDRDVEAYIDHVLRNPPPHVHRFFRPVPEPLIDVTRRVRKSAGAFLDRCAGEVLALEPRVVGFSCIFEQRLASLALSIRIKQQSPDTIVVFGGPTLEGIQGLEMVRRFDAVDAVVSGEGDLVFPQLVRRALSAESLDGLEGVYTRANSQGLTSTFGASNAPIVEDMDALPYVDYNDYFSELARQQSGSTIEPVLFVEGSRGCWWGEKQRCTFCAFGGASMRYRSKSGERTLDELRHVAKAYPGHPISLTDNIVDMDYFKNMIPQLAVEPLGAEMACDMKANLRKDQIRALRDAGITLVQLGIESLSTPILEQMRKGISAIECIQVLKWCRELGVQPDWNILWGFPGEPSNEYDRMARLIPFLVHLPPPEFYGEINVCRFSPCFEEAEQLGIIDISPSPAFTHIFPFPEESVANLATYFTYGYRSGQRPERYSREINDAIRFWKREHRSSDLFFVEGDSRLAVWDQRTAAAGSLSVLSGVERGLYLSADRIRTRDALQKIIDKNAGPRAIDVDVVLQPLVDRGLMIHEEGRYLALAIPVGEFQPKEEMMRRFRRALAELDKCRLIEALVSRMADGTAEPDGLIDLDEIRGARTATSPGSGTPTSTVDRR